MINQELTEQEREIMGHKDVKPRAAISGRDCKSSPISGDNPDFGFAFNDSNYSDRILRIEIVAAGDNKTAKSGESNWSEDGSKVLKVETLHISSPILAAKSHFFRKLFSNGMMESKQRCATVRINESGPAISLYRSAGKLSSFLSNFLFVRLLRTQLFSNGMMESKQRCSTLRINESEEAALMELLHFMYCNTLTSSTTPALLDVLMVADKFEVASCMTHCSLSLEALPMTVESALLYLDLSPTIQTNDAFQCLTDAAKQLLALCYKDIRKYQDEVLKLPLAGFEAVLSSNDLQVTSEDEVYDLALKWSTIHYQNPKEKREILSTRLGPFIRFPYMSCQKLREVLTCNDFDHEFATNYVLDALFFKAEAPHHQLINVKEEQTSTNRHFIERAYKDRPIKIVELEHPNPESIVYLDLKREECAKLFPSETVFSQAFHLGEHYFSLYAQCAKNQESSFECFGLGFYLPRKGSGVFDLEFEFSAKSKPTEKYVSMVNSTLTFEGRAYGVRNLFRMPWGKFMAKDCVYFIDDVLHLKAELTIKR